MPHTADGLYYETHGSQDAPCVLLSSGLGGATGFWAPQMPTLKDYRVILYDHRGTNRSVRTLTDPHSVDAMAADIASVMDAVGAKSAHIVGHAAGGLAGLALALKRPRRVASLTVINGWSRPDPHIARCFAARVALLKNSGRAAFVRAQAIFLYPATWISENDARLAADEAHALTSFPAKDVALARIAALLAFDIDARLPKITCPVLVAASADDMLVPSHCSERLAQRLPNSTLEMAPWGGHAFTVTAAEAFNDRLRAFLRAHARA